MNSPHRIRGAGGPVFPSGVSPVGAYPASVAGRWWLPGRREHTVPGTLTIDSDGQAELDTNPHVVSAAWFDSHSADPGAGVPTFIRSVLHGEVGVFGRAFTLVGCRIHASLFGDSTLHAECQAVVDGLWIPDAETRLFSELHIELENLTSWAGLATVGWRRPNPTDLPDAALVTHRPMTALQAVLGEALTITLEADEWAAQEPTVAARTVRVTETAVFKLTWAEPVSINEAWQQACVLQDLVTFAAGRASAFLRMDLHPHPQFAAGLSEGGPLPFGRLHLAGRVAADVEQDFLPPHKMVFTRQDIEFGAFIAAWFDHRREFRPVLATLLGELYLPRQYAEPRLGMLTAAAEEVYRALGLDETFMSGSARNRARHVVRETLRADNRFAAHATLISQQIDNRLTLVDRLIRLTYDLGDVSKRLLGPHREAWAIAVKNARNKIAHTSAAGEFDAFQLSTLADATKAIIELTLLSRLGLGRDKLGDIADKHYGHVIEELPNALPNHQTRRDPLPARTPSAVGWPRW
jgi:ApeA N-terminal domain 1